MGKKLGTLAFCIAAALLAVSGCSTPAAPVAAPSSTPPALSPTVPATPTDVTSPLPTPATAQEPSPLPTPATAQEPSPLPTPQFLPTETAIETEASLPGAGWAADGIISDGEYDQHADFGDIRLWWQHDGTWLYVAMEGDTSGWVAVGINPQQGMEGASFLFGYVENGEAKLWDAYGTARTGPNHPPDEDLGGTNDIAAFAGTERDGVTRFEAQIPLDSGDQYDHRLEPGQTYPIIVAIGGADDFNA